MIRVDARSYDQVRPLRITRDAFGNADASVLFELGNTKILISVSLQQGVPHFLRGRNVGWLTAEYAMLPCSTTKRIQRDGSQHHKNARGVEISRLIGRSFRSVTDVSHIGERTIIIDCDVLQADGGTRVAAITGSNIALHIAQERWLQEGLIYRPVITERIAGISVGIVSGSAVLDLNQVEDNQAEADFNFVLTESGSIIEVQGTAEQKPVSWEDFEFLKKLALSGVESLFAQTKQCMPAVPDVQAHGKKKPLFSLASRSQDGTLCGK